MGFFFFYFRFAKFTGSTMETYRFGEMPRYLGAIMKYGSIP